ncbi:putative glycoside hydrolase [Hirschia litorea]|uniref:Glycoside hydrolase n=1 Tax=Hirschia litorea TaxID=1199156 RepID=A0ABW2IJH7_9PROT
MNTFNNGSIAALISICCSLAFLPQASAEETSQAPALDPNIHYVMNGKSVGPWEYSLNYGKEILTTLPAQTTKSSLTATSATKTIEGDAIRLKWSPKGIKNEWGSPDANVMTLNLINRQTPLDFSTVQNDAALVIDVRVIRPPQKVVELNMECNWDWKCRSAVQLKSVFKKLPKNEWVSLPLPLKCFADENFDFSKITSPLILQTTGKMEIEVGDIRLAAFPADQAKC